MSPSSDSALVHLRKLKSHDGWAIEYKTTSSLTNSSLMRLLRSNVPVTDSYFFDIYHSKASGQVVGILTNNNNSSGISAASRTKPVSAQVLVDASGRPMASTPTIVTVTGYPTQACTRTGAAASATAKSISASSRGTGVIPDAQNRELLVYGGGLLGVAMLSRLLVAPWILLVLVPILYFYLLSSCPDPQTFDPKKELKRILRGHYLPDNHPEKPKGLLSETFARISASVTTELATLPGYEVTMIQLAGAAVIACARVPSVETDYYWIGLHHHWYYVYSNKLQKQ